MVIRDLILGQDIQLVIKPAVTTRVRFILIYIDLYEVFSPTHVTSTHANVLEQKEVFS